MEGLLGMDTSLPFNFLILGLIVGFLLGVDMCEVSIDSLEVNSFTSFTTCPALKRERILVNFLLTFSAG